MWPGLTLARCQLVMTATATRVSRVAAGPLCLHAVGLTPAGPMEPVRSYYSISVGLPLITREVSSCINRFEACSAFTHVTACMLAESPMRPSTPEAPTASFPSPPLRLLPGGANQFPGGTFTRSEPAPFTAHAQFRFINRYGRILSAGITILQHASPRSTHGDKAGYESPVSEDGDIGQYANCTRDLAARAERKNADPNADGPDRSQQPHAREIPHKGREIVRVRKDSASRANERSDSSCNGDAGCCRTPLPLGEPSAEQHLSYEGRN